LLFKGKSVPLWENDIKQNFRPRNTQDSLFRLDCPFRLRDKGSMSVIYSRFM